MIFKQYASSSSGNMYEVISGHKRLMIEAGMTWKVTQAMLDFDLTGIDGWLVTHEHKDHSKCIDNVINAGIKALSSEGTFEALGIQNSRNLEILTSLVPTRFYGWTIYAFDVCHDCNEPQGFFISDGKQSLLFITDSYNVELTFENQFDIVAIECSYDADMLSANVEKELVNEVYAKRLLKSHMEKQACMAYLKQLNLEKCREIHLLHMSTGNIDKTQTVKEFEDEFMVKVVAI